MKKLDLIKSRSLMYIRRLNFERCNRYETVAEHSFYVGILAYQLACEIGMSESEALFCMKIGVMHDIPEAVTGDIPFLVRRAMGDEFCSQLDYIGEREMGIDLGADRYTIDVVRIADALEFTLYLKEEINSGNVSLIDIYQETLSRLVEYRDHKACSYIEKILGMSMGEIMMNSKEMPDAIKH